MVKNATLYTLEPHVRPPASIEARIQTAISRIAQSDCPILIVGEPGVGKRPVAIEIHSQSNRSRRAFQEIDCGETDAQSLTTALSSNGTVYLTEVGDLSLSLQELIIQAHFCQPTQICRLLCGSSRELQDEIKLCRVREDFSYLISPLTLRIRPLRCRKSEILLIADELLTHYSKQFNRPKPALGNEIVALLMEHDWPENLPELQTAIKTFAAIGDQAITLAAIRAAYPSRRSNRSRRHMLLKEATKASSIQVERQLISEVLASTGGNRKRAATELGISYKALLYKLKRIETDNKSELIAEGVSR
jgi:DNA-binding NtrC family response regulator